MAKEKRKRHFDVPAKRKHLVENVDYHHSTVRRISVPNSL